MKPSFLLPICSAGSGAIVVGSMASGTPKLAESVKNTIAIRRKVVDIRLEMW